MLIPTGSIIPYIYLHTLIPTQIFCALLNSFLQEKVTANEAMRVCPLTRRHARLIGLAKFRDQTNHFLRHHSSSWWFWTNPPALGIQSYSQMMIKVPNHLLSIIFSFHYHSQKVIGSLGLKNMRKSNWKSSTIFGVEHDKCLSCHHLVMIYSKYHVYH